MKKLVAIAAALALAVPCLPRGAAGSDLLDLLRPGSRPGAGLIGDPFGTVLGSGGAGWGERMLDRPAGARIEAESAHPLDRSQVPFELSGSRVSWMTAGAVRAGGSEWGIAARLTRPEWSADWGSGARGVSSGASAAGAELAVRPPLPLAGMRLTASFPVWSDPGSPYRAPAEAVLGWTGSPRLALAARMRTAGHPEAIRSTLGGERIEAPLNLATRGYEGEARVRIASMLEAHGSIASTALAPLDARGPAPVHHLDPRGETRTTRIGATLGAPGRPRLLARSTSFGAAGEADLSWGGERFGNLQYARIEARSWLVGAEWPAADGRGRWLADFETARATTQARADIESWPFTSTLVDLLGARRVYRASGDLKWEGWHVATERRAGRTLRFSVGAGWYDVRPEGTLDSWRPAFLVFGSADRERSVLGVRRLQLGEIALAGDLRVAGFDLGCDVRQLVFGRAFESGTPVAASGAVETPSTPPASSAPGTIQAAAAAPAVPAGGHLRVSIGRRF